MPTKHALASMILFGALLAPAAQAEISSRLKYIKLSATPEGVFGNMVEVANDGTGWVEPQDDAREIRYRLTVEAETTAKRIKIVAAKASVYFEYYFVGTGQSNLRYWDTSQVQDARTRPVHKLGPMNFIYSYDVNGKRAVNACKRMYNDLRDRERLSNDEILAEDRVTTMDQELYFAVNAEHPADGPPQGAGTVFPGSDNIPGYWRFAKVWNQIIVKCKAPEDLPPNSETKGPRPPTPGADGLKLPFQIQKIELSISPEEQAVVCPGEIALKIDAFATAAGTAKVRVLRSGSTSPIIHIPVVHHPASGGFVGSKVITAKIGQSGQGGFVAEQPSGGQSGPQFGLETQENVHQGVYWIEALNGVKSNHAAYKVTCTPPPFEPGLSTDADGGQTPIKPTAKPKLKVKAIKPGVAVGAPPVQRIARTAAPIIASVAAQPDLVIKSATPPSGGAGPVRVLVKNQGTAKAKRTSLVLRYTVRGRQVTKTVKVRSLGAGKSHWVSVHMGSPISAAQQISLMVDPNNRVVEGNETNNGLALN